MPAEPYPPSDHLIHALRIRSTGPAAGHSAPIVPHVCVPGAGVRAEFLAILVDLAGGVAASLAAHPDGTATRLLALHLLNPASIGEAHAGGQVLRIGRTGIEVEVQVTDGSGMLLAHADVSYARRTAPVGLLPADASQPKLAPGPALAEPLRAYLGIRLEPGGAICDVQARSSNSMGSLHGGAQAGLIAAAAEHVAEAETRDLRIQFLSHARKGPVEARAEILRQDERGSLVRVQTFDLGDDGRRVAVAAALT